MSLNMTQTAKCKVLSSGFHKDTSYPAWWGDEW